MRARLPVPQATRGRSLQFTVALGDVLRALLSPTTLPVELIEEYIDAAAGPWSFGVSAETLASEAILCHPPLGDGEIRVAVDTADDRPSGGWRITVATTDRPGLLATTAGTLTAERLSVVEAAVVVLPSSHLALQRIAAVTLDPEPRAAGSWDELGIRLRSDLTRAERPTLPFDGCSPVVVDVRPHDVQPQDVQAERSGRSVVTITAPDVPGLLWAAAEWFAAHGCNVESCRVTTHAGRAEDLFVVTGSVNPAALATRLGEAPPPGTALSQLLIWPLSLGVWMLRRLSDRLDRSAEAPARPRG
jgi:predicted amino acid-binding ACT domain protein